MTCEGCSFKCIASDCECMCHEEDHYEYCGIPIDACPRCLKFEEYLAKQMGGKHGRRK